MNAMLLVLILGIAFGVSLLATLHSRTPLLSAASKLPEGNGSPTTWLIHCLASFSMTGSYLAFSCEGGACTRYKTR